MTTMSRVENGRHQGTRPHGDGSILDLVRSLCVEVIRRQDTHPAIDGKACLLDVSVGDLRCVVLRSPSAPRDEIVRPSPREREIAALVARGYPNKWIASALGISAWTVATHIRRIFGKLGVSNRAEMVALLTSAGLLGESFSAIGPGLD